jgi:uncharacterized protein YjiS (DUF1127 family)
MEEASMAFMAEPIRSAPATLGRSLLSLGRMVLRGIIAGRMRQLARTLRHRREAEILAGLDEHMLADIGLNRADLRDAFSEPMWRDPTSVLVRRADERRTSGRDRAAATPAPRPFAPLPPDRPARLLF